MAYQKKRGARKRHYKADERLQVYLYPHEMKYVKKYARIKGTSKSDIARRMILFTIKEAKKVDAYTR